MVAEAENFWKINPFQNQNKIVTPKEIMEQQAKYLSKITDNQLFAEVYSSRMDRGNGNEMISHDFIIRVPKLDNYTASLFLLIHGWAPYPATLIGNAFSINNPNVNNEQEFKAAIKEILSNEKTQSLIQFLLAQ